MASKLLDEVKTLAKLTDTEAQKFGAFLDAWFTKHFTGNRISADTDTYNLCHAAKEELKAAVVPTAPAPEVTPAASPSVTPSANP